MTHDTRSTALSALLLRLINRSERIEIRRDVAHAVRELLGMSASRSEVIRYCQSIVRLHRLNHPCAK